MRHGLHRRRRLGPVPGCFRTLQEIATWSRMTDEARAAVMTDLPGRKGRIDPRLLGE